MGRRTCSNSRRAAYTRCLRYYRHSYVEELEPRWAAPPLRFGILIHELLDRMYQDMPSSGSLNLDFEASIQEWLGAQRKIASDLDEPTRRIEESEEMGRLAGAIMNRYAAKYAAVDVERWDFLGTEVPFKFPLHVPCSHCRGQGCHSCEGTGRGRRSPIWDHEGKLDVVARLKSTGQVFVWEHKTTVTQDMDRFRHQLRLAPQPRGYVWAARQLFGECAGVHYNVLRKKIPIQPKTVQCKVCRGKGMRMIAEAPAESKLTCRDCEGRGILLGSVTSKDCPTRHGKGKRRVTRKEWPTFQRGCEACCGTGVAGLSKTIDRLDTTPAMLELALRTYPHIPRAPYEEILERLKARGDTFLHRMSLHVPDRDIREWELEMYDVTKGIGEVERSGRYVRNLDACFAVGRPCPFSSICLEENEFALRNFRRRERDNEGNRI